MKSPFTRSAVVVSLLLAVHALLAGCGSNDKSTNVGEIAERFDSGDLGLVGTFVHTFPTQGTFSYRCKHHGGMTGTVSVIAGAPADSNLVHITDFMFSGAEAIKPGGYVRWVNDVSTLHTVTRP